ncbi:kinase-like domain-containing protein [Melanogaster broomeanus]|nr:kinase-like domain-containing protein [Melanogaster broomeanus]
MSKALPAPLTIVGHSNASPGSSVLKTSGTFKTPPHIIKPAFLLLGNGSNTARNLDDTLPVCYCSSIDLTGDVRGTYRVQGGSIDVALKTIRTYSSNDDDYTQKQKRLCREIKVWLNLNHVNIVPLLGTTMGFGQFPAMVCPWLANGQLSSYLERQSDSLKLGERLVLLSDVTMGLQYLHSQSVVHGDLSGSNVLVDDKGRACIADFGLSMLLTELGGPTFATSIQAKGTL